MTVELQESTKASELVALASSGEDVVLTQDGKILGRFMAVSSSQKEGSKRFGYLSANSEVNYSDCPEDAPSVSAEQASKRLGFLKGRGYRVPDDIKTPFKQDIEEMFYGNPDKLK